MTSIAKKQSILMVAVIFLLMPLFLLESCSSNESTNEKDPEEPKPAMIEKLPNKIKTEAAKKLVNNYVNTNGEYINKDFCFEGKEANQDKVVLYAITKKQALEFFGELDSLMAHPRKDSNNVRIGIHLAFRHPEKEKKKEGEPNLIPLINLRINQDRSSNFYPLTGLPVEHEIILRKIKDSTAENLIRDWIQTPVNLSTDQLYLNEKVGDKDDRAKFYTFLEGDTKSIYEYQQRVKAQGEDCELFLLFGKRDQEDYIPLRTILSLEGYKPIGNADEFGVFGDDDDPSFEFSSPCPPFCDPTFPL